MNILLKKMELRKFQKLINNKNIVLFTSGDHIDYVYNKINKKRYIPKNDIIILR